MHLAPLVDELDFLWMKPIFLQGVLAALLLVGGGAGDGGARAGAACEVGLPFCSVAITAY